MPPAHRRMAHRAGGQRPPALPLREQLAERDAAQARVPRPAQEGTEILGIRPPLQLGMEGEDRPGGAGRFLHHGGEVGGGIGEGVAQRLVESGEGRGDLRSPQRPAAHDGEERLGAPAVGGVGEAVGLLVEQGVVAAQPGGRGVGARGFTKNLFIGTEAAVELVGRLLRRKAEEAILPLPVIPGVDAGLVPLVPGAAGDLREGGGDRPRGEQGAGEDGAPAVDAGRASAGHLRQEARTQGVEHGEAAAVRPHGEIEGGLHPFRRHHVEQPRDAVAHPVVGVDVDPQTEQPGDHFQAIST